MTASKLEDALSLSPAVQREAFQNRHKYDLVIVYDARSPVWPKEGPLSRLWDMLFMGLDEKRLQRNPVILVGGYEKWREFIKMRAARHAHPAKGKDARNGLNGYTMMRSDVASPAPSEVSVKKANREAPVYQASQYAKSIAENVSHYMYTHYIHVCYVLMSLPRLPVWRRSSIYDGRLVPSVHPFSLPIATLHAHIQASPLQNGLNILFPRGYCRSSTSFHSPRTRCQTAKRLY